jgi:methylmalonyl-CoA epimerase (EC 5.1.99.1)
LKVPTKKSSSKVPDSEFPEFSTTELPGFLFVDHIAIAVCAGELEAQLKMYLLMGFRELHREEMGGTDQVREVLLQIGESQNFDPVAGNLSLQNLRYKNKLTETEGAADWHMLDCG